MAIQPQEAIDLAVYKVQPPLYELVLLLNQFGVKNFRLVLGGWTVTAEAPLIEVPEVKAPGRLEVVEDKK